VNVGRGRKNGRRGNNQKKNVVKYVPRCKMSQSDNLVDHKIFTWITQWDVTPLATISDGHVITPANLSIDYAGFFAQVTNLWNEYRVDWIKIILKPVPGLATNGLVIRPITYIGNFEGSTAPALSGPVLIGLPSVKTQNQDKMAQRIWRSKMDPEDQTFTNGGSTAGATGGIVWYTVGVSAAGVSITYMMEIITMGVTLKSRIL
jgi:hypothetical protein